MKITNVTPALENRLTNTQYPYESKEEAAIAEMLDSYGIPFFYKQATLVHDQGNRQVIYPTFSLPTYNGIAVNYIAMLQNQEHQHRERLYMQNQIPAVLLTPEDLEDADWQHELYEKLEELYHRPAGYQQQPSDSYM